MRVLVPLLQATRGNDPFFYLIDSLKGEIDFIVLTADSAVVEECRSQNIEALLLHSPALWIPSWHKNRFGKQIFEFWDELSARRRSRQQAAYAIEKAKPDAVLLAGDFRSIPYSLAQHKHINSVVLQITLDWTSIESKLSDSRTRQGYKGVRMTKLLGVLSKITRRQWVARVRGEPFLIYGNDLGRTAGAVLAGVRFGVPLKGGMGARYVCVNGEHYRDVSIEAGIFPEQIAVTGSPEHDRMAAFKANLSPTDVAALRAELDIPSDNRIIALFSQPFTRDILPGFDYPAEVDALTRELVAISEKVCVVIKLHPAQQVAQYEHLTALPQVRLIGSTNEDFNNRLIAASRFAITRTSTVGYNAFALDVPLLTYAFYDLWGERYYEDLGGSWHVKRREDFIPAARALLFDDAKHAEIIAAQKRVRDRHMILDGKCCQRIGEVLRRI